MTLNKVTTAPEPMLVLGCGNCGMQADSAGGCKWNCRKRYSASCYDCGEPAKPGGSYTVGTEHFGLDDCPGFMESSSEWCDGSENPGYQRAMQEFWDAHRALRKAYDPAVRRAEYEDQEAERAYWDEIDMAEVGVHGDTCCCKFCDPDEDTDPLDFNTAEWMNR